MTRHFFHTQRVTKISCHRLSQCLVPDLATVPKDHCPKPALTLDSKDSRESLRTEHWALHSNEAISHEDEVAP